MTTALQGDTHLAPRPKLWRVTDRASLIALRRSSRRARLGPLSITWLPPAAPEVSNPPAVAFAIGRAVGGAVVRNTVRRRLRAALRELRAQGRLPGGSYLLGGSSGLVGMPWPELQDTLATVVTTVTAGEPR